MKNIISFIVGIIFALGLGISGMTKTHVVRGFLDIFGDWNPALMGVMIGAILVHSFFYRLIRKRESPIFETQFHLPTKKDLDIRLLLGSAIFGLGWGWAGICPGPGIVASTSGNLSIVLFIFSMLLGMGSFKIFEKVTH